MDVVRKYGKFILNPSPTTTWKIIRGVLHWITLPIKLAIIGGLGFYQIFKHRNDKSREVAVQYELPNPKEVAKYLPVWITTNFKAYVCRTYTDEVIDGTNHNPDHMCSRHGTYTFLMDLIGQREFSMDRVSATMMAGDRLARGFNYNEQITYNGRTTSGDMLCGLNMAMLNNQHDGLLEKYELLVQGIIDNDFSLLENQLPDHEEVGAELWEELARKDNGSYANIKMKSARGMWQPGLETVGAQALTILSTLKLCYKKTRNPHAKEMYDKLFTQYGYGILSLFPTAYIDKQRGYFNDHNCMISLYVLSKLADTAFEKFLYKKAMQYVWSLSSHWYNGYYTGLLLDAYPELLKKPKYSKQLDKCLEYLGEADFRNMMQSPESYVRKDSTSIPPPLRLIAEDEFYPDIQHDKEIESVTPGTRWYRTGLGYFASLVMCLKAKGKL